MPRKSIGETAMTDAERQARYRAARTAGVPVVRTRCPADHRGRARRWTDHVTGLVEAQVEFAGGPTMLEIRASSGGMSYVTNAEPERRVA